MVFFHRQHFFPPFRRLFNLSSPFHTWFSTVCSFSFYPRGPFFHLRGIPKGARSGERLTCYSLFIESPQLVYVPFPFPWKNQNVPPPLFFQISYFSLFQSRRIQPGRDLPSAGLFLFFSTSTTSPILIRDHTHLIRDFF